MKKLLWLDDKRNPLESNWLDYSLIEQPFDVIWVKKYYEFVDWITENGLPDAICFDHDLSDIHINKSTYKEKNGMSCAEWLVEYCTKNNKKLPSYSIHSINDIGKANIDELLKGFNKSNNE